MYNDNPLALSVLGILKNSQSHISLYQLMKILEQSGYDLDQSSDSTSQELKLFRKNFVVMNALYGLRKDLNGSGYYLIISSLMIQVISASENNSNSLITQYREDEKVYQSLSDYYLNWDNFHQTDEQDIAGLLTQFWNRYKEYDQQNNEVDKRLDSIQLLGLQSTASWKDIQHAYRQLVTVYHPDKGGNSLKFIKIREAYLFLKLTHNMSY